MTSAGTDPLSEHVVAGSEPLRLGWQQNLNFLPVFLTDALFYIPVLLRVWSCRFTFLIFVSISWISSANCDGSEEETWTQSKVPFECGGRGRGCCWSGVNSRRCAARSAAGAGLRCNGRGGTSPELHCWTRASCRCQSAPLSPSTQSHAEETGWVLTSKQSPAPHFLRPDGSEAARWCRRTFYLVYATSQAVYLKLYTKQLLQT